MTRAPATCYYPAAMPKITYTRGANGALVEVREDQEDAPVVSLPDVQETEEPAADEEE